MVILKGFVTLNPNDCTKDIKKKITSLFQTKFPHIESFEYDFVKRERNKICTPTTERSFSWNFSALKNLWGQGKLYCRLNVTPDIVEEGTESDDDTESYSSSDVKNIWHPQSRTKPSATLVTFYQNCQKHVINLKKSPPCPPKSMLSVGGFVDRCFRDMNNIVRWGKGGGCLET